MAQKRARSPWRALTHSVVARIDRIRSSRRASLRQRWCQELADHIVEATRTTAEYTEVVAARRDRLAAHQARGDAERTVAETWALASIELAVGHLDRARERTDAGLDGLADANAETIDIAVRTLRELGRFELHHHRPGEAARRYERAVAVLDEPQHDTRRLMLLADLARTYEVAWEPEAVLRVCAAGLAMSRRPSGERRTLTDQEDPWPRCVRRLHMRPTAGRMWYASSSRAQAPSRCENRRP